jgi:predicted aspartyl protease
MAKVFQKVWVENATDISNFQTGLMDHIRGGKIEFRVDTGATGLLLPTSWIKKPGLTPVKEGRLQTGNGIVDAQVYSSVTIPDGYFMEMYLSA